jgi:membrane associated rhomboid family serine protease
MDAPQQQHADAVSARFRRALLASMVFVALLGLVHFASRWLGDLSAFALVPQSGPGLLGVLTAPLLHGSPGHWLGNSAALLVLVPLVGTVYPRATLRALPLIWLLSGLGTWLIGRPSLHIGASGLTHGLLFLLLALGLLRRDRAAIAAALIAFFLYGGMLLTVLPREPGVSWEYHLCGALAGILAAVLWRRADPEPPRRLYSWELEPDPEPAPDAELEPPAPEQVPVLWQRPAAGPGVVLPFPPRPGAGADREPGPPGPAGAG